MNVTATETSPTPRPGAFGRYRIVKKLASGGMGEIFLANLEREEGFSKRLVVKKLLPGLSQNPAFVAMFNNEARLAARLSHTNIVHIFDFGRMDDSYFIAMEWVNGQNLGDVISTAKENDGAGLPVRIACEIAVSVLQGLDYAHRARDEDGKLLGLTHRDIAPKNILISYEGEVKIIDFGLAKAAAAGGDATEAGALKGSYCYMSPEQIGGRPMDARSDLFSVALSLFEMLAGERLFPAEMGLRPLLEGIHRMDLAYWEENGRDPWKLVPSGLAAILKKALARDPAERYQSAKEFAEALEQFLRDTAKQHPKRGLSDYMHELFAEQIAAEVPETSGPGNGMDATRVSAKAQQAIQAAAAAEAGPTVLTAKAGSSLLFNVLAALIIVAIVSGGGFLAYRYLIKPRLSPAAAVSATGIVNIVTDPPGAVIYFDGVATETRSPASLGPIPPGTEHVLRVEFPGYKAQERKFTITEEQASKPLLQQFALVRSTGQVFLITEPAGAKVEFNGAVLPGKTPILLEEVPIETEHQLALSLDGYRKEVIPFTIPSADRVHRFTVELAPLKAALRIRSDPAGARIFVEGDKTPHYTPYETDKVEIGRKLTVRVKKPGWKGATETRETQAGRNDFSFQLEPLALEARLRAKGSVVVFLDEQPVPTNPLRLSVGDHLVRVRMQGADEEFRLRLGVREHPRRNNGLAVEANVDAKPWAKVKTVPAVGKKQELTTPVSGLVFPRGSNRLLVALPGGGLIELSFDVP